MKRAIAPYLFVLLAILMPAVGLAQFSIPGGSDEINVYIQKLYQFGFGIGGILAVLMIVIGGIYYSVSGAVDKKSEGKEMITSALLGLLILFGSYLILQTVNPVLVTLDNPSITRATPTPSQFSCTPQNVSRECTVGESPLDANGQCQCYRPTPGACPVAAYSSCPSGPVVKPANEVVQIPRCATQAVSAVDPALFTLLTLFDANSWGSCDDAFEFTTMKATSSAEYYYYPYYPSKLSPSSFQCVVYAVKVGGRTIRPNIEGLQKCEPQR